MNVIRIMLSALLATLLANAGAVAHIPQPPHIPPQPPTTLLCPEKLTITSKNTDLILNGLDCPKTAISLQNTDIHPNKHIKTYVLHVRSIRMQNSSITHTTPAGDIVIHTSGNIHIENSELHTAKDLTIECISERCVVDSDKTNELHAGHTIIVRAKNSVYLKGTNMEAKHAVRIFGTYDAWLQKTKENQMPMVAAQFFSLVSIKTESRIGDWVFVEAKIRIVVRSWHGKARVYSAHVSALKVFVLGATYADIARTHVDAGFLWVITNTTCGNNPCVRAWRSNVTAKQVFLDTPNHNGTINVCAATFTTSHPKKGVVANNVPTAPYPMTVSYTNAQCTALGLGNGATFKTQKTSIPPPHKK